MLRLPLHLLYGNVGADDEVDRRGVEPQAYAVVEMQAHVGQRVIADVLAL